MKKIFIVLIFTGFFLRLSAQLVPNASFEIWVDSVTYEEPESWSTDNPFTSPAGLVVVEKSTDAASGTYSARLETKDDNGIFQPPGLMTLGEFGWDTLTNVSSFTGGIPITSTIDMVQGKYKYAGVENDSATLVAYCFRHPEGEDPDTVAMALAFLYDEADWTDFSFQLDQLNSNIPDTFNLIIQSSGPGSYHAGSVLYIDDISLSLITDVDEMKVEEPVSVYPNPMTDRVTFELPSMDQNREIIIYDVTGRMIKRSTFSDKKVTIGLDKFPMGVYTYRVISDNQTRQSGTFVKQ